MFEDLEGQGGSASTSDAASLANVRFELEVQGSDASWVVENVSLQEAVSEPLRGVVEASVAGDPPPISDLLGRPFNLRIERGNELRTVRGIVRHASAVRVLEDSRVTFDVVSSLWRLGLGIDSRTYLDLTIPELVQTVIRERLGGAVTVDVGGLTQTYEVHEMLIQYRESALSFISRWMEHEGIFFFLAEGDDGERVVLADTMENLPLARASNDGRVGHWGEAGVAPDAEHVSDLRHTEGLGVTRVALSEFDWSNPSLQIEAEQSANGPLHPAAEIYDHADAISLHRFDGRQYNHNTATRNAQIRAEALALARRRWTMRSSVVTAQPGHVLRVEGAPDGDLDGAYMIVRCDSGGQAREGGTGSWKSSLALVPTSMPYRPPLRTPRPIVPGPETAFVVGPEGQEIHTDAHGRVRVHFHWDRVRGRAQEDSSCWLRVAQNWAGDGFGTFFLPRIGMEVVVEFLGGNPDRPLVGACVYDGTNLAHVELPEKKTQSYIRTKSSQNSTGYNEIRFEDHAGAEFISVHAQRDLLERVLHDHRTHVGHDQRIEVDHDQELIVHNNRMKNVDTDEVNTIGVNRATIIGNDDSLHVKNDSRTNVDSNMTLDVLGNREEHVLGSHTCTIDGGSTLTVTGGVSQTITSGGWTMTTTGDVVHGISGHYALDAGQSVNIRSGTQMTIDATTALRVKAQVVTIASDTAVNVRAPSGIRHVTPTQEQNTMDQILSTAGQIAENARIKLGVYSLALTLSNIKIDYTNVKVDLYKMKVDNEKVKARLCTIYTRQGSAAEIARAATMLLG